MEDSKSKYSNIHMSSLDTDSPSDNDDEPFCDDVESDITTGTKNEIESVNCQNSNILPRKLLRYFFIL